MTAYDSATLSVAFGILVATTLSPHTSCAQEKTVNILAWADVFSPRMLEKFTEDTGIRVIYDSTPSDEFTETKILAGKSGYDVIGITTEPYIGHLVAANALAALEISDIPRLSDQDSGLLEHIADAGVKRAVGLYYWGTTGFGLTGRAKEILPSDAPLDSLALIFEPKYAQLLNRCGLSFLDSPVDMIPLALLYLGINPESTDTEDLLRVERLFAGIRPFVTKFDNVNYRQALANGDICAAVGWGGDIILARDDADAAKQDRGIQYIIPKEGGMLWMSGLAMLKDAPNSENARIFINYMLSSEAGADLAIRGYSPAIQTTLLADESRYPNASERLRLHYYAGSAMRDAERRLNTTWTRIKYR
ncbi:extracellular solute-binding protein [Phyllobacterium sp. TAF24]|uniref:extracellular solute-binding protein n=1 Tax=Phyllobacterium sp. TAF24 TaxID=3233068 RepID=UPI003F9CB326